MGPSGKMSHLLPLTDSGFSSCKQSPRRWLVFVDRTGPLRGQSLVSSGWNADLQGWGSASVLFLDRVRWPRWDFSLQGQGYACLSLLQLTPALRAHSLTQHVVLWSFCNMARPSVLSETGLELAVSSQTCTPWCLQSREIPQMPSKHPQAVSGCRGWFVGLESKIPHQDAD